MKKILISGLTNIETTLKIENFPLNYFPVTYPFFGINSHISGVGYNIIKALQTLGRKTDYLTLIGKDIFKDIIINEFDKNNLNKKYILDILEETAQSVIIYEPSGRRQIHTDLKNIQNVNYPLDLFKEAASDAEFAVLCNINFSRPFLKEIKKYNIPVATDVHVISDINDEYNKDFMDAADILFLSNEAIIDNEENFIKQIAKKYNNKIIIVGLGAGGVLMYVRDDNKITNFPSIKVREIVNTVGAGDSLFSSFIHFYLKDSDPYKAVKKAQCFAAYKIGANGAVNGFIPEAEVEKLFKKYY